MLLLDVRGKEGTVAPAHIVNEVPKLNAGLVLEFTFTVNVAGMAHSLTAGVNV
jgi:hypothetical protein